MNDDMATLFRDLSTPGPASSADLDRAGIQLGIRWPADYRDLLTSKGAVEGWVGPGYLALWPVGDLVANNRAAVSDLAPNLVGIGTDGAGELFAFDTAVDPPRLVMVPLVGLDEPVVFESFLELLRRLAADDLFGSRGAPGNLDGRGPAG